MSTDAEDDDTRVVSRRGPRHGPPPVAEPATAPEPNGPEIDETIIVPRRPVDDRTIIVARRPIDDHTRVVPRRHRSVDAVPADAPVSPPADDPAELERTVRSVRRADTPDPRPSARRALPAGDSVEDNHGRYEPPQVRSGSTVRYPARPTPAKVPPRTISPAPESVAPDAGRMALAATAAQIRARAVANSRRLRRLTLVVIATSTLGVIAAATWAIYALVGW